MAIILQTTFSNALFQMKIIVFWFIFPWMLLLENNWALNIILFKFILQTSIDNMSTLL